MKFSIIISYKEINPYYKDNLKNLLNYLSWIIDSETEIILVEQDKTSKINWLHEIKKSERINHIFIKNDGVFNKWNGYNIGVTKAQSNLLIFNDINMYLKLETYRFSLNLLGQYDVIHPYKSICYLDEDNSNKFLSNNFNFNLIRNNKYVISDNISNGIFMMKKEKFLLVKGFDQNNYGNEDKMFDNKIKSLFINNINDAAISIYNKEYISTENTIIENITYDFSLKHNFSLTRTIPKRMFFYWSGCNLSWMRYMTLYSFRKLNPDWEVILYLSDNNIKDKTWVGSINQDYFTYDGINYLDKLKELNIKIEKVEWPDELKEKIKNISPIHESDLFRYYQLYKNGGFYSDMDILFFRSIDDFYNEIIKMGYDTIIHEHQSDINDESWLTIGFLGSSINNEYYKNLFEFGINNYMEDDYQSLGVNLIYKMFNNNISKYISDRMISKYPNLKFYNIPTILLYKYNWTQIDYCFTNSLGIDKFNYNSIGYHWYGGGVLSQKYNNILNENNYKEYETTFSKITDEVIKMKIDEKKQVIKKKIKISIVTAYYNRKNLFYETLKSIAKSKFKDFELIVVDDGSDIEHNLDEFLNEFLFLKIIKLKKENKWYTNPCIPFNIGIRAAIGDIIMLQNPECLHVNDILSYANENINDNNYISISAYGLNEELNKLLFNHCNNNTVIDFLKSLPNDTYKGKQTIGWRNHSVYFPTYFHFCSIITKKNMDLLGGFDERYAYGTSYDDGEFLERIKRLKLNLIIEDKVSVIHQWHETFFYNLKNVSDLQTKNEYLFENVTKLETKIKVN